MIMPSHTTRFVENIFLAEMIHIIERQKLEHIEQLTARRPMQFLLGSI